MRRIGSFFPTAVLIAGTCSFPLPTHGADDAAAFGRRMDYGPAICHSVMFQKPADINARTWEGPVRRAWLVRLDDTTTICYDLDRLAVAAYWQGGFLDFTETHYNSYKGTGPPLPVGRVAYRDDSAAGNRAGDRPIDDPRMALDGYFLHERRAVLAYRIGDRAIQETPHLAEAESRGDVPLVLGRTLRVGAGSQRAAILIGGFAAGKAVIDHHRAMARRGTAAFEVAIAVDGQADVSLTTRDGMIYAEFPPADSPGIATVWFRAIDTAGDKLPPLPGEVSTTNDPQQLVRGGPARWDQPHVVDGELGDEGAAYTVDYLGVPELPYGSWMRLTGIAPLTGGDSSDRRARLAVSTLSGDVWIVSYRPDDLRETTWRRFATGLYEPLGLLVSEGSIYVRGRDRITRLVDLNGDNEADFYENFHCQGEIGPGYHAFVFELLRDDEGHFYYVHSGRKSPSIGEVVRIRPDGKSWETIATRFRHPNGMGLGGPYDWLTIADNPDGSFPTGGMIIQRGREYGQPTGPRTAPFLYLVPPTVDSSAGSHVWTDPQRWGPLGGCLIHTSFSKSTISYVLVQDNGFRTDLVTAESSGRLPNGFAVKMPFQFRSGVMRGTVHPIDGQLYLAGQRGWDTNAARDACVARVRYTGRTAYVVEQATASATGIRLRFSCPLDRATVDYENFVAERIGAGQVDVEIEDVVAIDANTVFVEFLPEDVLAGGVVDKPKTQSDAEGRTHYRVVDPLAIEFRIRAADGTQIQDVVYCTVNGVEGVRHEGARE